MKKSNNKEKHSKRVDLLKEVFGVELDKDLAEILGLDKSHISKMRTNGFSKTTNLLIDKLLLDKDVDVRINETVVK